MHLVTLNGPIGSGKSWVANNLRTRYSNVEWFPISFQDTLATATMALFGAEGMDYPAFKIMDFFGHTGREWMIILATEARRHDDNFFARIALSRMRLIHSKTRARTHPLIFIADSNGFANELDFMRAQTDIDVLACSIEPLEYADKRGELYSSNDSRFNLAHKCNVVTVDSSTMLFAAWSAIIRRGWA